MKRTLFQPERALMGAALLAALAGCLVGCSKSSDKPASDKATVASVDASASAKAASAPQKPPLSAHAVDDAIGWTHAASAADVDAAFALAKAQAKPIFVYWGAGWCPPCNQVKATIFNRQDFIERSRAFVPVYVDGDSPGAQKLGARFHVSGYPTMVLFNFKGEEITRLPGEVDPARYTEVLDLGMSSARPAKVLLADALAGSKELTPNDWRMLSFYSFDTDQQQLVAKDKVAPTLSRLAELCPQSLPQTATRLRLKSLAANTKAPGGDPAARSAMIMLLVTLGDPAASREEADVLLNWPVEMARAATAKGTTERRQIVETLDVALRRLEADTTLSRADRMQALIGQVDLARIDMPDDDAASPAAKPAVLPKFAPALLADVREQTARADHEVTDGYERQAVITSAAYLLDRAGLSKESDRLLEDNLAKSHSPYYLMSELAGNARRRGDKDAALRWYHEAYDKSEGPATRLQWGASYVTALVDLSPDDETTIEAAATKVLKEAAQQPDAFYERSARSMQKVGTKLQAWGAGGAHAAPMGRLRAELSTLCGQGGRGEAELATCTALLTPPRKA